MTREEAIKNMSIATGEPEDIVERRANAVYEIPVLPIVNYYDGLPKRSYDEPKRKAWVSPYAKFDKIRKRKY